MSEAPTTAQTVTTPPVTTPPPAAAGDAPAAGAQGAAAEHLARLHKMSTTAGVTNRDYVAVNQTAVVAAVLGLLASLALVSPMFLFLPVAGAVVALVALRQIRDSVGTQSGRPIAWAALALAVGFGLGECGVLVADSISLRADERKIEAAVNQFAALIRDEKYPQAYKLLDDEFQNRVQAKDFERIWSSVQGKTGLGRIEYLTWNGVPPRFLPSGGSRLAYVNVRIKFPRGNEERLLIILRQVGGDWQMSDIPAFFRGRDRDPGAGAAQDDVYQIP